MNQVQAEQKESYAPFESQKDLERAVLSWEKVRKSGRCNMFEYAATVYPSRYFPGYAGRIMKAYENGEAEEIISAAKK